MESGRRCAMRWMVLVLACGCAAPEPQSPSSDLVLELRDLPDSSASFDVARDQVEANRESGAQGFLGDPILPTAIGSVVEVWEDRVAVEMDEGEPMPRIGDDLFVYDRNGYLADAKVARLRGRIALGPFRVQRIGARVEVGGRVGCLVPAHEPEVPANPRDERR